MRKNNFNKAGFKFVYEGKTYTRTKDYVKNPNKRACSECVFRGKGYKDCTEIFDELFGSSKEFERELCSLDCKKLFEVEKLKTYKVEKLDIFDIEAGDEIWDCKYRKWIKVEKVTNMNLNNATFYAEGDLYYSLELENFKQKQNVEGYIQLTAIKVKINPKDVITEEYKSGEYNYIIFQEMDGKWETCQTMAHKSHGTKYYTKENAELMTELLNMEEK